MVILKIFLTESCDRFLTKFLKNRHRPSLINLKGLFILCFPFQVYIPLELEIKLTNYFLRTINIFKFVVFFDLCKDFRLFFRFKVRIPLSLRPPIIYKNKYQCCNVVYVGETVRHFHKPTSKHMCILAFTVW